MRPVLIVLMLWSCKGKDAPDPVSPQADSVVCGDPSPVILRRLSRDQYTNTVWSAVDLLGGDALTLDVADTLLPRLNALPADARTDLSRQDQAVSQAHADGWYAVAQIIADASVEPAHFDTVFEGCDTSACAEDQISRLVPRLQRRPMNPEELAFYLDEVYAAAPTHADGLRDTVLVAIASPAFAHQIEHGTATDGELTALDAFELASRLSYHFWSMPPDDALWNLATDGSLLDDAVYAAQVRRVFDSPKTETQLDNFFAEWLQIDRINPMNQLVGDPKFEAFAAGFNPSPQLSTELREDALGLVRWHVQNGGTLDDLWTSDLNTAPSMEVAQIYGADVWDGVSKPRSLATGVHAGLLTRPAFTASGLPNTRPIHKGVLIRRQVLCDSLGAPPADLGPEPEIDPRASTRTRTEQLTEIPGSVCIGCHQHINGLGFPTENFDGLGRHRTLETVYDEAGNTLAEVPVNTQTNPGIEIGIADSVSDGVALASALAANDKVEACFAEFWFRHTYNHEAEPTLDQCSLDAVSHSLSGGQSLAEGLRAIALDPSFKLRKFDESTSGAAR